MSETTTIEMRIKEVAEDGDLAPGFYWTLDDGPEEACTWSGPHANPEAAKTSALNAITDGYLAAATMMFNGE